MKFYDAHQGKGLEFGLATVVNVEESSYRRVGARMLVCTNGEWEGGISGGCLEGDALKRTNQAIYNNKASIITYDTLEDDEYQIGVGLGCNGKIDVLVNKIDPIDALNELEVLRKIVASGNSDILIKVLGCEDATKIARVYTKDQIRSDAAFQTCNAEINKSINDVYINKKSQILNLEEGSFSLLVECINSNIHLVVCGDNYDIHPLLRIAKELGWDIDIVARKRKLAREILNYTEQVFEYEELFDLKTKERSVILFMTHDFNWDKKLIHLALKQDYKYYGVLGPKKRLVKLESELSIELNNRSDFFAPIGLDIGAETPEEIAVSIVAEIIAFFRKREGGHLKNRVGSIHDRE